MKLEDYYNKKGERPLDNIPADGGFARIFRKVGFVGDSLASGEFEVFDRNGNKVYLDLHEHSWGQYMARKAGFEAQIFCRGGMSAREYCTGYADSIDAWNPDKKCQAYIIALGVNDIINQNQPLGCVKDDICDEDYTKNAETFAGYYGMIVQRYKEIQPDAKFFFMTMLKVDPEYNPENDIKKQGHRKVLYDLAEHFTNSYVLDMYEYAPVYDSEFKKRFFLRGHMNPMGYAFTGDMTLAYIDYIIRNDPESFAKVGFMGMGYD